MMTRSILFLLFFIAAFSFLLIAEEQGPFRFTSQRFGVQIEVPQNWAYETSERLTNEARERGRKILQDAWQLTEEEMRVAETGGALSGVLLNMKAPGADLPAVQISYSDHSANPAIKTELDEAENIVRIMSTTIDIQIVEPPKEVTFVGRKAAFVAYEMFSDFGKGEWERIRCDTYFLFKGNYSMVLTAIRLADSINAVQETEAINKILLSFRI